ncbi:glyoxalase [Mycobacterium gallinarum]|uniref:Glyoxalase n=1 Tax=Mycobacterium gallinarum TaxID=39689 RepID=A0A9W4FEP9_9MYCO|nr:VOC family protein [Mycobacterium gallinarum]BBY92201.1 glyoxalase [Mycobacterium gallinarum]
MNKISVRYIVDDVDAAVDFYTSVFQFEVAMRPAPGFAMLNRGELRLLLNSPGAGGAGQTLADGSRPEPGGWNRFQLQVDDLDAAVADMRKVGADLRIDVIDGRGGRQALVPDPAGNLVEMFQPYA